MFRWTLHVAHVVNHVQQHGVVAVTRCATRSMSHDRTSKAAKLPKNRGQQLYGVRRGPLLFVVTVQRASDLAVLTLSWLGPDGTRRDTARHLDHDGKDGEGRLPREDGQGTRSMEANLTDSNNGPGVKRRRPRNETESRWRPISHAKAKRNQQWC